MINKGSTTSIRDCKEHCPHHLCPVEGGDHGACVEQHRHCPLCRGRHWRQDCPRFTQTICPVQTCRVVGCKEHCGACGGNYLAEIFKLCPAEWEADNLKPLWSSRMEEIIASWHAHLHRNQWTREEVTDAKDIKSDAWCQLRCKEHPQTVVSAESLKDVRATAWKTAVFHLQDSYENGGLDKALTILAMPECRSCQASAYLSGHGDFDKCEPVLTDWGKRFVDRFPHPFEKTPDAP